MLLDLIDEVKVISSKMGFEEEADSDEHDSAEDLEPYQLSEFNQLVVSGRQRQRNMQPNLEDKEDSFSSLASEEQELEEINPLEQQTKVSPLKTSRSV